MAGKKTKKSSGATSHDSAIITQPVRLELRERDDRVGSYPKTQDLNGGEKNLGPFDDRNTIDFLSPYATTTIQFQGKGYTTASLGYMAMHTGQLYNKTISVFRDPLIRHNDSIILRDSVGNSTRFKFWRTQFDVIMGNGRREGRNVRIFSSNDSSYIAEQFTKAVNDYTGTLYIEAERTAGGYVKLTQQIPGHKGNTTISSYVTGTSQNLSFSGGSPLKVLYPAMIPNGQYADYLNSMYMRTSGKSEFQEDPTPLPATYQYGVMSTGSIEAPGVMRKGVCDSFPLPKTGSLTTEPFNDSAVTLGETRFYMTGTTSVPHFSSPLKSKTQITIDLSVNKKTRLGMERGDHPKGRHNFYWKGMGYYNFDLKCWAPVGDGITGLADSKGTNDDIWWPENISRGILGFGTVGGAVISTGSSFLDDNGDRNIVPYSNGYLSSIGRPTTSFGFPRHGRYFATSSCALKMNKYINRPFVFEKAVLTFNAEFKLLESTGDLDTYTGNPTSDAQDNAYVGQHISMASFFILNQRENVAETIRESTPVWNYQDNGTNLPITISGSIPGHYKIVSSSAEQTYVNSTRDLVTYGQISLFTSGTTLGAEGEGVSTSATQVVNIYSLLNRGLGRELNIGFSNEGLGVPEKTGVYSGGVSDGYCVVKVQNQKLTGSNLVMEIDSKLTCPVDYVGTLRSFGNKDADAGNTLNDIILNSKYDGRTTERRLSNDRSLNSQVSFEDPLYSKPQPEFPLTTAGGNTRIAVTPSKRTSHDIQSPYVLYPEDEIIFGWQAPIGRSTLAQDSSTAWEDDGDGTWMAFQEGPARITLFGSYLKEDKEYHGGPSQNLTSDAIHEAIHYDNPVADQFQIAPRSAYSGSYLDMYPSAPWWDLIKPPDADPDTYTYPNAGMTNYSSQKMRSVIGDGINVISASIQRFTRLSDISERYYDSVLPDIRDIWNVDGAVYDNDSTNNTAQFFQFYAGEVDFASGSVGLYYGISSNTNWLLSFPFEPRYSSLKRKSQVSFEKLAISLLPDPVLLADTAGGKAYPARMMSVVGGCIGSAGTGPGAGTPMGNPLKTRGYYSELNTRVTMFGFGDGVSGSVCTRQRIIGGPSVGPDVYKESVLRGFKYGLKNVIPDFTSNVFRCDRYGQFRDMLEQRRVSRFFTPMGQKAVNIAAFGSAGGFNVTPGAQADAAVEVKFVTSSSPGVYTIYDIENLPLTDNRFQSSNLSQFATSSVPFFDDDISRNRKSIADTFGISVILI